MSEIELSREEDSVSSLANLAIKDGLITFAGINSSPADVAAGKNEHLRSFKVNYPARRRSLREDTPRSNGIGMIGKAALFSHSGPKSEVYQRIIRLSPVLRRDTPSKRIGAVATGLGGTNNEIVVFDATFSDPAASHIIQRIMMPAGGKEEAADLAITELQKELFSLVYCTDYDVYATAISYDFEREKPRGTLSEPRAVYTIPQPHAASKPVRPTFRALRFLTPEYLLLLMNLPGRTGAELLILRLFPSTAGEIVARKALPKRMKAATGLDVCVFDADAKTGERQIAVAVVGQDISVEVMTIDYLGTKENAMSKFRHFITLRDVHPHQITGVVFSPFQAPRSSSGSGGNSAGSGSSSNSNSNGRNSKPASRPSTPVEKGPQYLRLATVSVGNTVVVDHFQLTEVSSAAPPPGTVRHILSSARARLLYSSSVVILVSVIALVSAILLQAVLGASSSSSQPGPAASLSIQDSIRSLIYGPKPPSAFSASSSYSSSPSILDANNNDNNIIPLRTLLSQRLTNPDNKNNNNQQQAIVLRPRTGTNPNSDADADSQITAEIHADLDAFVAARKAKAEADAAAEAKAKQASNNANNANANQMPLVDGNDGNDGNDDDSEDSNASNALLKTWDELAEHERAWWTARLLEAGVWAAEGEGGEEVLRGVFFGG